MIETLRRLNDRERYWGMTWPGWAAAIVAGAVLYATVKLSPFALKPTVTITALILATIVVLVLGVSGQALSPSRHLLAVVRYQWGPKQWTLFDRPDPRGLVLTSAPDLSHRDDAPLDAPARDEPRDVDDLGPGWLT